MNTNDSDENTDGNSENERIEQLLKANERLKQECASTQQQLAATQQQLASLSALSTSLAQHQQQASGETLVWFGTGTDKHYLNARSIRLLTLKEGMHLGDYHQAAGPSGTYAVVADEMVIGDFLPPAEAEQKLDEIAGLLIQAMQPPAR